MASGGQCLPLTEVLKSDFLTCSICMNVYDKPKILPCLHTYCEKCLSDLIASQMRSPVMTGKITCPECRDVSDVPAAGVHTLRTCFFISGLIDLYHTKTAKGQLCSLCVEAKKSTVPAVSHCIDCADDLCSTCSAGHCCSRVTAHHRVVGLEDLEKGKFDEDLRTKQKIFCSLHDTEELRYYCESCRIPICRDCRLLTHIDHTCKSIPDAVTAIVPVVKSCIEDLESQLKSIVTHRQILESKIAQVQDFRNIGLAQVDNFTARMMDCLLEETKKATRAVCEKFDMQEKPLLSELDELQTREALVQSSLKFSSHIMRNARDAEILSLVDLLYTRLQKLNSQKSKSSVHISLKKWVLYCRVDPETAFDSLFGLVQVSQDSPNVLSQAELQPVPYSTLHQPSICSRESSVVQKTVQLGVEDGIRNLHVSQEVPPITSLSQLEAFSYSPQSAWAGEKSVTLRVENDTRTPQVDQAWPTRTDVTGPAKSEPVPYSHVLEMPPAISTGGQKSKWVVEKTVKLRLKEDLVTPHIAGMVLNDEDTLFIADIKNKKVKMSSNDGKFIKTVRELDGETGLSGLGNYGEQVICASPTRICRITKDGDLVKGNVLNPSSKKTNCNPNIAVYNSEYIAIAEGDLGRVSVYQTTGKLVRRIPLPDSSHDSKHPRPVFVAFNKRGHLVVADWARKEVVILTLEGQLVRRFTFDHQHPPCCVCSDKGGRMFLSSFGSQKILCLKDENARWTPELSLGCNIIAGCPLVITAGRGGRLYVSVGDGLLRIYRQT